MKEKTIYVACDGKEFLYEEDCRNYENRCSLAEFHESITVLDENGEEIIEWWEEDNPDNFYGLYFTTQEAWQAFLDFFGEEALLPGNYYSRYIESMDEEVSYIGTHWVYFDDDEWHCLEKDLEIAQNKYKEWMKNF